MNQYDGLDYSSTYVGSAEQLSNNGACGSWWNNWFVPDSLLGVDINECCKIHDHDYRVGKTKKDKDNADARFRQNMYIVVIRESDSSVLEFLRKEEADLFYSVVCEHGDDAFYEGKR